MTAGISKLRMALIILMRCGSKEIYVRWWLGRQGRYRVRSGLITDGDSITSRNITRRSGGCWSLGVAGIKRRARIRTLYATGRWSHDIRQWRRYDIG